jgi:ankyrin repeat protein
VQPQLPDETGAAAAAMCGRDAGSTPMFFAAQDNRLDVVTLLVAAGADVNMACDNGGGTPLHVAAEYGHAGVVSVLLETAGADMNTALTDDG